MFELLKAMLSGHNPFASGGLLLMVIGALGVYLRAVPETLWQWFLGQTTMMVTVKDDDAAFTWVKEWLLEQDFLRRVRRLDLDTTLRNRELALIPAPGKHWFWHARRPFAVWFFRSEDKNGRVARRCESLTFWTIGRSRPFLKQFINGIVDSHHRSLGTRSCLFVFDDGWTQVQGYTPRLLQSVILKGDEKEQLIRDIEQFKNSRQRYLQLGVPYHRGYLFYGPPGTGKTSLVSAIAEWFQISIFAINLTAFNDRSLGTAINDVPPNSLILFEDIDCMNTGEARLGEYLPLYSTPAPKLDKSTDKSPVTLSGLLNVLDGFSAPDNVLFMMTSNRVEALDRALLRPGRIDYKLYLGKATEQQKIDLFQRFFPNASYAEAKMFADSHPAAETMAEFQGLLLRLEQDESKTTQELAQALEEPASYER